MTHKESSSHSAAFTNKYEKERDFWYSEFSDGVIRNIIPYDVIDEADSSSKYLVEEFVLSPEISKKLFWLANESDYRLLMLLITGLTSLLKKYTGNNDITIGTSIYKQKVDGDFINKILPIRNVINEDATFKDVIILSKDNLENAVLHQNFPIDSLSMNNSGKGHFLFNNAVLLKNIQKESYIDHLELDLLFVFERIDEEIKLSINYSPKLYKKSTIDRFYSHFDAFMQKSLDNINEQLKNISLITAKEKEDYLFEKNTGLIQGLDHENIVSWFEDIVERFPNNKAVSMDQFGKINGDYIKEKKRNITYKELNDKANELAYQLRKEGLKDGSVVGLLMYPGIEVAISIMGVLKARGVYLPIAAETPNSRMEHMLKDCKAEFLVVDKRVESVADEIKNKIENLKIISVCNKIKEVGIGNLDLSYSKDDPIYIIYTSGSMGYPKGVLVGNSGLINYVQWRREAYEYDEKDISLQLLSYSFDGFYSNFFTSLLTGGLLIMVPETHMLELTYLNSLIKDVGVTNTSLIPRLFESVFNNQKERELESLRFVVLAGEKTDQELKVGIRECYPKLKIINEFGLTETSVTSIANLNYAQDDSNILGSPINNNTIYILDKDLNPVPKGICGELYISGIGLAKGYLNEPGLTSDSFIKNPFKEDTLMYKTGDLASWSDDDTVRYFGRKDYQVKIRGFRIELSEIEECMKKHPMLADALVITKMNHANESLLIGYYVSKNGKEISDLTDHLQEILSDYMIPSILMEIGEFPKNQNGKLDYNRLPEPKISSFNEYVPPKTDTERRLVSIWSEVLNIDESKISSIDNFFESGGHSLNATIIISKVQKEFNIKIPIIDVFEYPTVSGFAKNLEDKNKSTFKSLEKALSKDFYPLSSGQERMYFIQEKQKNTTAYNIPLILKIEGSLDVNTVESIFNKLAERHESLRTVFVMNEDRPAQKILDQLRIKIDCVKHDEINIMTLKEEFVRPFNLNESPLFRVMLVELKGKTEYLFFDIHHIITDALSMQILVNDFIKCLSNIELPELKYQYKDFSESSVKRKGSDTFKKQEEFWMDQFKNSYNRLKLPVDNANPENNFIPQKAEFIINKTQTDKLNQIARDNNMSLFIMMLGITNVFISKLCNQEDIVIGIPVAGRLHDDFSDIVGLFINTLVLRNNPAQEKKVGDFLKEVKQNTFNSLENQEYDFDALVDKLGIKREAGKNPLIDLFFMWDNFYLPDIKSDTVSLTPVYYENNNKFDLSLLADEKPDSINFTIEYNAAVFNEDTILFMSKWYTELVDCILNDTQVKIKELQIDAFSKQDESNSIDITFNV
jgi:amino acid adenylation domain-containing protein